MKKFMVDGYTVNGENLDEFFKVNKDLWNKFRLIKTNNPLVYTMEEDDDAIIYKRWDVVTKTTKTRRVPKEELDKRGLTGLYNELRTSKAPMLTIAGHTEGNTFFTASEVIPQAMKAGGHVGGHGVNRVSRARNDYAEELLENETLSYVYLKDEDILKIVAARSRRFTLIPLTVIEDIFYDLMGMSEWGEFQCKNWSVSIHDSRLFIEFPQLAADIRESYPAIKDNYIPGIMLALGCTGISALTAAMTWRKEGSVYPMISGKVKKKHYEGWSKSEFIADCKKDIWGKYTAFPEAMVKAATTPVSFKGEDAENGISVIIENIFKQLKVNQVFKKKEGEITVEKKVNNAILLRKKLTDSLLETYKSMTAAEIDFTFYDIISAIMEADIAWVPESYQKELRETLASAWTIKY